MKRAKCSLDRKKGLIDKKNALKLFIETRIHKNSPSDIICIDRASFFIFIFFLQAKLVFIITNCIDFITNACLRTKASNQL